jgi:Flp pilus assembly protein TadG
MFESIRSRVHRLIHEERAVALTEFALVAPLLFVVLFGTIDFGKAINYWNAETQMAAQGARLAAVNGGNAYSGTCVHGTSVTTVTTLADYIQCQADTNELRNGGGSTTKAQVCITFPSGGTATHPVTITVSTLYTWLPLYGLIDLHLGRATIRGQATMRLERDWLPAPSGPVGSTGAVC